MLRHLFIIYIFNNKVFTGYTRSMYKYLDRFLLTSKCKENTVCQRKLVSGRVYYENWIRLLGHTVNTSDTYCIQDITPCNSLQSLFLLYSFTLPLITAFFRIHLPTPKYTFCKAAAFGDIQNRIHRF